MILDGLLFINNVDVYQTYGVFLSENNASDHANYSALLKPSDIKPTIAVNFREENGEKLPDELLPRSEPRDISLQFAIIATSTTDYKQKYKSFVQFLKAGWLNINVTELGETFKMYFLSCDNYDQLTALNDNTVAAKFKVRFREPVPFI
ncbi:hypothetical protein FACS1894199_11590 [Bacteroidia bacterium]|nr:hypothetical protein FACS1894199_11590 [Bacteroidia bacterium]